MEKVSVIIPTYNSIRYLPETLDSVFRQTHTNLEVIVVDDGSTDNTEEFLKQYPHPLVYIKKENQGVAEARNTGIKAATANFLAFLDSDDLWEPEKIRLQMDALKSDPDAALVYTKMSYIDEKSQRTDKSWTCDCYEGLVFEQLFRNNFIPMSSVLIRKQCVEKTGLFKKHWKGCEDYDYWLRVCAQYPVKLLDQSLLLYRRHSSNMSADGFLMSNTLVGVLESALADYKDTHPNINMLVSSRMEPAYEEIGIRSFYREDYANARKYLWKSLCLKFWSINKIFYWMVSLLPYGWIAGLRAFSKSFLKKKKALSD